MSAPTDLDRFYSDPALDDWRAVLGPGLHYHNGFFTPGDDLETAQRRTIENFYPWIAPVSTVLDVGCGWGGTAQLLRDERECTLTCITISAAQAAYCRSLGLEVRLADVEQTDLAGSFDVAMAMEVLSHIRDKQALLEKLRGCATRLVMSVNCTAEHAKGNRETFGGSMHLCTPEELRTMAEAAGWRVVHLRDRRQEGLPTVLHWQANLQRRFGKDRPADQLGVLRDMTEHALRNLPGWARANPLIDLVAD